MARSVQGAACPICGRPLRGRQRVACSKSHAAVWSRRQRQARVERERAVRDYLRTAAEALEAAGNALDGGLQRSPRP